jgi:hypothetical protein
VDAGTPQHRRQYVPMSRTALTREQLLRWNPSWSYSDRELIERHLNRLEVRSFYTPPGEGYVGCIDDQSRRVLTVYSGFVEFARASAPDDLPDPNWLGLALSTFSPHAGPTGPPEEGALVCPVHHVALPLSGVCDDCQ